MQYWRCTQQVAHDEVAACVVNNAQKGDWLGQIIAYQGATSCRSPTYWIAIQVATVVFGIVEALGFVLLRPSISRIWRKIKRSPSNSQPEKGNIWGPPSEYVLEASNLIASLGGELLAIFLAVIVMQNSGIGVFVGSRYHMIWYLFVFFAIRPRAAPVTGLLGFFRGWADSDLAGIVIDGILSIISGLYWTVHFFSYAWSPDIHPFAPTTSLRLLGIGAILSAIPPLFWWLAAVSYAMKKLETGLCASLVVASGMMIRVLMSVLALPLLAILEIFIILRLALKQLRSKEKGNNAWSRQKIRYIWQPIHVDAHLFRRSYAILVFLSWVINLGNWMFYSIYLTLEGDLYCPSGSTAISAILILVPVELKLPLQALSAYIEE